ncbi:Protein kinase domain-containing protein [Aphelenchoides besseyi]|nr:Protein kinase domain-containing protein [Aphelenchoides besseyi]
MLKRRIQDLTVCFTYNFSCLHPQHRGRKEFGPFNILTTFYRGGFGIVYRAYRIRDGLPVAVKYVEHKHVREWTMCENQLIPTEICYLELCNNISGVVNLIDWFASSKGFMIVMERPEKCLDLFDVIAMYGRLEEDIARWIFVQIVDAVLEMKNLHSLVHRDIKDENVIVNMDTGVIKLVDFGAADFVDSAMKKHFQGTRSYCPPEWFKHKTYFPLEATSWSLGVLLYILIAGTVPFKNEIQTCVGRLHFPSDISKECQHLIRRCLCITPKRRITLAEIRSHPWMAESTLIYAGSFRAMLKRRALARGHWQSSSARSRQMRFSRRRNSALTLSDAESEDEPEARLRCRHMDDGGIRIPQSVLDASNSPSVNRQTLSIHTPPLDNSEKQFNRTSSNCTPIPIMDNTPNSFTTAVSVYDDCSTNEKPQNQQPSTISNVPLFSQSPSTTRHPRIGQILANRTNTSFDIFQSVNSTVSSNASTRYESLPGSTYQPNRTATQDDELSSLTCSQSSAALYYSAHESLTSDDEMNDQWYDEYKKQKERPPYASEDFWLTKSILSNNGQNSMVSNQKTSKTEDEFIGYEQSLRSLLLDDDASSDRTRTPSLSDDQTDTERAITPPIALQQQKLSLFESGRALATKLADRSTAKSGAWQRVSVAADENGILSTQHKPRIQRRESGRAVQRLFSGIRRARSLKIPFPSFGVEKPKTAVITPTQPTLSVTSPKETNGELPVGTVKRLAAHSYDALVVLGGTLADQGNSTARLRNQLQINNQCAVDSPSKHTRRPISTSSIPLHSTAPKPQSPSTVPSNQAKPNLQYETVRFPLAVFDICAQQLPILEQVSK